MDKLDRNQPYGMLGYNELGRKFVQAGKFYGIDELLIKDKEVEIEDEEQIDALIPELKWETLNWREIKKLVIDAGGEWSNKANGIEFLKG